MSDSDAIDPKSRKPRGSADSAAANTVRSTSAAASKAGAGGSAGGAAAPPPPPPVPPSPPPAPQQPATQSPPPQPPVKQSPVVTAAKEVSAGAAELETAAGAFALSTNELESLTKAYLKVTDALAKVDAAVRAEVTSNDYVKDVHDLLAVAALSESLREWFPVDPELTSVRGTVLVPKVMAEKKPEAAKPKKPEDKSLDVLLKELLAHLAK